MCVSLSALCDAQVLQQQERRVECVEGAERRLEGDAAICCDGKKIARLVLLLR